MGHKALQVGAQAKNDSPGITTFLFQMPSIASSWSAQRVEQKYNVTTDFPNLGLHNAAAKGDVALVSYALRSGQPVNSVLDGILPLHAACAGGNEIVIRLLIDLSADVNAPRLPRKYSNSEKIKAAVAGPSTSTLGTFASLAPGSTPLHFAAANGHTHVVKLLLQAGADPDRTDKHGVKADALAASEGWQEVEKEFKTWAAAVALQPPVLPSTHHRGGSTGSSATSPLRDRGESSAPTPPRLLNFPALGGGSKTSPISGPDPMSTISPAIERKLQMQRSLDNLLSLRKPYPPASPPSSAPPSPPRETPATSSDAPAAQIAPVPMSRQESDPGHRRPSLPLLLDAIQHHTYPHHRSKPPTSSSHPPVSRPRSAGQGAAAAAAAESSHSRKLGSKYSLLGLFKKANESSSAINLASPLSMSSVSPTSVGTMTPVGSPLPMSATSASYQSQHTHHRHPLRSKASLDETHSSHAMMKSKAAEHAQTAPANQTTFFPSSPSLPNIPAAVISGGAIAESPPRMASYYDRPLPSPPQFTNPFRSATSSGQESPGPAANGEGLPMAPSAVALHNYIQHNSKQARILKGNAEVVRNSPLRSVEFEEPAEEGDEDSEDEETQVEQLHRLRSGSHSTPQQARPIATHRRTSSSQSAAFQRARALRNSGSFTSLLTNSGSVPNSPISTSSPVPNQRPTLGHRRSSGSTGPIEDPNSSGTVDDSREWDDEDEEHHEEAVDEVGEPVWRRPSHPTTNYTRTRGLSFNSTSSSTSAFSSPEATAGNVPDYPYPHFGSDIGAGAGAGGEYRIRGGSISSVSTVHTDASSILPPLSSSLTNSGFSSFMERDRNVRHIGGSSTSLRGQGMPPTPKGAASESFTSASSEKNGGTRHRRTSDSSSTTGRGGRVTPISIPLTMRSVSSHAQAQSLVQAAQNEILSTADGGLGDGSLSLSEQLALFGGALEIERRFAKGEAQKERRVSLDIEDSDGFEGTESSPVKSRYAKVPLSPPKSRSAPKNGSLGSPNHPLHRASSVGNVNGSRVNGTRVLAPAANISRSAHFNSLRNPRRHHSEPQSDEDDDEGYEDDGLLSVERYSAGISIIETIPTPTDSPASIVSHASRLNSSTSDRESSVTSPPVSRSRVVVHTPAPLQLNRTRTSEDSYEPSYRLNSSTPIPTINVPEKMVNLASPTSPPLPPLHHHYGINTSVFGRSTGSEWNSHGTFPRRKVGPADVEYIEGEDGKTGHKRFGAGLKNLVQTLKGK